MKDFIWIETRPGRLECIKGGGVWLLRAEKQGRSYLFSCKLFKGQKLQGAVYNLPSLEAAQCSVQEHYLLNIKEESTNMAGTNMAGSSGDELRAVWLKDTASKAEEMDLLRLFMSRLDDDTYLACILAGMLDHVNAQIDGGTRQPVLQLLSSARADAGKAQTALNGARADVDILTQRRKDLLGKLTATEEQLNSARIGAQALERDFQTLQTVLANTQDELRSVMGALTEAQQALKDQANSFAGRVKEFQEENRRTMQAHAEACQRAQDMEQALGEEQRHAEKLEALLGQKADEVLRLKARVLDMWDIAQGKN